MMLDAYQISFLCYCELSMLVMNSKYSRKVIVNVMCVPLSRFSFLFLTFKQTIIKGLKGIFGDLPKVSAFIGNGVFKAANSDWQVICGDFPHSLVA